MNCSECIGNKKPWPLDQAINEMSSLSGKIFDPEILHLFLQIQSEKLEINDYNAEKIYVKQIQAYDLTGR